MSDLARHSLFIWRTYPLVSIVAGLLLTIGLAQSIGYLCMQLDAPLNEQSGSSFGISKPLGDTALSLHLNSFQAERPASSSPQPHNEAEFEERWQRELINEFPSFPEFPKTSLPERPYQAAFLSVSRKPAFKRSVERRAYTRSVTDLGPEPQPPSP